MLNYRVCDVVRKTYFMVIHLNLSQIMRYDKSDCISLDLQLGEMCGLINYALRITHYELIRRLYYG